MQTKVSDGRGRGGESDKEGTGSQPQSRLPGPAASAPDPPASRPGPLQRGRGDNIREGDGDQDQEAGAAEDHRDRHLDWDVDNSSQNFPGGCKPLPVCVTHLCAVLCKNQLAIFILVKFVVKFIVSIKSIGVAKI